MDHLKEELHALLEQPKNNLTEVGKDRLEWLIQMLGSQEEE